MNKQPDFIKLTISKSLKPVYVEVSHIAALFSGGTYTDVYLTGDSEPISVLDSPEHIMKLLHYEAED